jgi:hypothetical protein
MSNFAVAQANSTVCRVVPAVGRGADLFFAENVL